MGSALFSARAEFADTVERGSWTSQDRGVWSLRTVGWRFLSPKSESKSRTGRLIVFQVSSVSYRSSLTKFLRRRRQSRKNRGGNFGENYLTRFRNGTNCSE